MKTRSRFALLPAVLFSATVGLAATPPNIVYILADDLGYGDLGCYGQLKVGTPHIDRLAAEGMRFTQHYAGNTVCAPSRSALLEGKHTGHTAVRSNNADQLLRAESITLAESLKAAGYRTGIVGKWGVGHPPPPDDPLRNGFDFAYGYVNMWHAHNCFPEFLYRNGEKILLEGNRLDPAYPFDGMPEGTGVAIDRVVYAPDRIQEEALAFIDRNRAGPFFLYVALNLPHDNGEARRVHGDGNEVPDCGSYADRDWPTPHKEFARMMQHVDDLVGAIEVRLQALGLDQNTLVAFSSDNGPHVGTQDSNTFFDRNGPLRGTKRDLYEGGLRVPLIVKWPGQVEPGATSGHVSAMWDIFPTFAAAAGAEVPGDIDGISFLPTLLGNPPQPGHAYLYWEFYEQGGKQAVRQGDWKAVRTHVRDDQPVLVELFDLAKDPGETTDLSATFPDVTAGLLTLMAEAHQPVDSIDLFGY
ncbi:MAG: arylsulfatase [Opitutaceae bacterium]